MRPAGSPGRPPCISCRRLSALAAHRGGLVLIYPGGRYWATNVAAEPEALVARVDEIAEISNSLRRGTAVRLAAVHAADVA